MRKKPQNPLSIKDLKRLFRTENVSEIARATGFPQKTVDSWKRAGVPSRHYQGIAARIGLKSVGALILEAEKRREGQPDQSSPEDPYIGTAAEQDPVRDDFVTVGLIDVKLAAGGGSWVDDEQPLRDLAFRRDWLVGRMGKNPSRVKAVTISGSSMEPAFRGGDIVLVDLDDRWPRAESVYAFRLSDGRTVIKELRLAEGAIELWQWSPSELFAKCSLDDPHADQIIQGKVFWRGGRI